MREKENVTRLDFIARDRLGIGTNPLTGRVLLIPGGRAIWESGLYEAVLEQLDASGAELFELSDVERDAPETAVKVGAALCAEEDIDLLLAVGSETAVEVAQRIAACVGYDGDRVWDLTRMQGEVLRTVVQCLPVTLRTPQSRAAQARLEWAHGWLQGIAPFDVVLQEIALAMAEPEMLEYGLTGVGQDWLGEVLDMETAPVIRRLGVDVLGVEEALPVMEGAAETVSRFCGFLYDTLVMGNCVSDLTRMDAGLTVLAM